MARLASFFVAALLLGAAMSASAQVYRWTEPDGRTAIGDRPPPGVKAMLVSQAKSTPVPSQDAQSLERELQRRDAWQAALRPTPTAAPPTGSVQRDANGFTTPRGQGTHNAPQGDCARYQEMLSAARNNQLQTCVNGVCGKTDGHRLELLQREAAAACAKR